MKRFKPTKKDVLAALACEAAVLAVVFTMNACGPNITQNQTRAYNAVYKTIANEELNNFVQSFGVELEETENLTINNAYLANKHLPKHLLVNVNGTIVLIESKVTIFSETNSAYWADETNVYAYSNEGYSTLGASFTIAKGEDASCYVLHDSGTAKAGDYVIHAGHDFFPAYSISDDVAQQVMTQMQKGKLVVYANEVTPLLSSEQSYEPLVQ